MKVIYHQEYITLKIFIIIIKYQIHIHEGHLIPLTVQGWTSPRRPGHLPGRFVAHADLISVFAPDDPGHVSGAQNNIIVLLRCLQANKIFIMINFD